MITKFSLLDKLELKEKPNELLSTSFVLTIIGKPGSGKSTIIQEILMNNEILNGKFDIIFIFSPSKFEYLECEENKNWIKDFSIEKIFNIISIINEDKQTKKNVLFIFDDLISQIRKERDNDLLLKLFFNRRHLIINSNLSFILVSQRYIIIPPSIRSCITHFIYFKLTTKDYITIKEDLIGYIDLRNIALQLTNDYDFIFLNLEAGTILKNFKEKIII